MIASKIDCESLVKFVICRRFGKVFSQIAVIYILSEVLILLKDPPPLSIRVTFVSSYLLQGAGGSKSSLFGRGSVDVNGNSRAIGKLPEVSRK